MGYFLRRCLLFLLALPAASQVLQPPDVLDRNLSNGVKVLVVERKGEVLVIHAQGLTTAVSPFGEQLARARYLLENCIRMPIVFRPLALKRRAQA